ncbi:MAG TPA: DUF5606 domain-containing protein [Flavobacteriaceae bacterium]|nr:DUF5606 domain-containing protein [Flavobacteriaceae bacterium]
MALDKIISITGKPGLYELKAQTNNGFLAESLADGKRLNISAQHNVSLLSEIAIYTLTTEVPLYEVFTKIYDNEGGKETINHKAPKIELEEFFFNVLPDYDEDRVYASDIKKVVQWYNILHKCGKVEEIKQILEEAEKAASEEE